MSVTLTKDTTTVTLPNPSARCDLAERKRQTLRRTQGGSARVHDQGVTTWEAELLFESLTDSEKSDLRSFFHTAVNGMALTFTYTDEESNQYTARFLEPALEFTKVAYNLHDVTIKIELDSMPA